MAITFWIAALGIPTLLLIGNAAVRYLLRMDQSVGTDVGLMSKAFDATVLIQIDDFRRYVWYVQFHDSLTAIFTFNLVMSMLFWFLLIAGESRILDYRAVKGRDPTRRIPYPYIPAALSFILAP